MTNLPMVAVRKTPKGYGAFVNEYVEGAYEPGQHEGTVEIMIAKQRNGPTGEVTLTYLKQFMRFENFAVESPFSYES